MDNPRFRRGNLLKLMNQFRFSLDLLLPFVGHFEAELPIEKKRSKTFFAKKKRNFSEKVELDRDLKNDT